MAILQSTKILPASFSGSTSPARVSNKPYDQAWAHILAEPSGAQSAFLSVLLEVCFRNGTLECKPERQPSIKM